MDIGHIIRGFDWFRSRPETRSEPGLRRAELLELRTAFGLMYVRPSGWERVRLRWAFRHFRVLPPQLLSASEQRLISDLARSAVVTPEVPVLQEHVFGVVENVRYEPPASTRRKAERVTWQTERGKSSARPGPVPIRPLASAGLNFFKRVRFTGDARSQQWMALGALAAICGVVILLRLLHPAVLPAPAARSVATRPALPATVLPALSAVTPDVLLPVTETVRPRFALPSPVRVAEKSAPRPPAALPLLAATRSKAPANELETIAAPSSPELSFVSELPQGHFAEPVVTDRRLVGELRLRALISSDGSVKEVTVVSGNPRLAEVGMRAVRRWRYQALGHPGEAETLIRMRFFGEDGVSIATLAK